VRQRAGVLKVGYPSDTIEHGLLQPNLLVEDVESRSAAPVYLQRIGEDGDAHNELLDEGRFSKRSGSQNQ
jgi:hypothetical protein